MILQEPQRIDILIQHLLETLNIDKKDAVRVFEILTTIEPIKDKLEKFEQLKLENLDIIVGAFCVGMITDAIERSYYSKSATNQKTMGDSGVIDIDLLKNKIFEVAVSIQNQLTYQDALFLFLLILPILFATGALSAALITEVTVSVLKWNGSSIQDLIIKSNEIVRVLFKNEETYIQYH